jgi:hypothetical protein
MSYLRSCGHRSCVGTITAIVKQSKTPEQKSIISNNIKAGLQSVPVDVRQSSIEQRKKTGYTIGDDGMTSYDRSVAKREATCSARYGDSTYNNPTKISQTKRNWTNEQKASFLHNLKQGHSGGWMSDHFTDDTWQKRRCTREGLGLDTPLSALSEWKRYQKVARMLTERQYRAHKDIINPNNHPRALAGVPGGYHLDHIIPICRGFVDNVPLDEITAIDNLQMLPWLDNVTKDRIYNVERK